MGFNGDILVGRGERFLSALNEFWNWDKEVAGDWQFRDGWRAVLVRTPAFGDELDAFARAVGGPVLACWVFESDMGHIRGVGATGKWEAWLNPAYAAHLRASSVVDHEIGGGLYPDGRPEDFARLEQLEARFTAELADGRPDAVRAVVRWAGECELRPDAARVERILAEQWEPFAQRGFFALLTELGLREEPDVEAEPGPGPEPDAE